jgi:hypothetical protein
MIGGACINVACIPTKTLVRSAQVAETVRRAAAFGTRVTGVSLDMKRVAARTAGVAAEMVDFNRKGFEASGLELILGWGRFVEPRVVEPGGDDADEDLPRTGDRAGHVDEGKGAPCLIEAKGGHEDLVVHAWLDPLPPCRLSGPWRPRRPALAAEATPGRRGAAR